MFREIDASHILSKYSNFASHIYEILHNESNTSRISRYWYGNRLPLHKCPLIMITRKYGASSLASRMHGLALTVKCGMSTKLL